MDLGGGPTCQPNLSPDEWRWISGLRRGQGQHCKFTVSARVMNWLCNGVCMCAVEREGKRARVNATQAAACIMPRAEGTLSVRVCVRVWVFIPGWEGCREIVDLSIISNWSFTLCSAVWWEIDFSVKARERFKNNLDRYYLWETEQRKLHTLYYPFSLSCVAAWINTQKHTDTHAHTLPVCSSFSSS